MNLRNRKLVRTAQIILGAYLLFTILGAYVPIFPAPEFSEAAGAFLGALFATGYMVILMQLVFVVTSLMFIFNKWSAFGAVLLAPITVNIILFHVFLEITGWWAALIVAALNIYLGYVHWPRYKPMFSK